MCTISISESPRKDTRYKAQGSFKFEVKRKTSKDSETCLSSLPLQPWTFLVPCAF